MSEQVLSAPTLPRAQSVNIRGATLRAIYIIWKRDLIRYGRDRMRLLVRARMGCHRYVVVAMNVHILPLAWLLLPLTQSGRWRRGQAARRSEC